MSNDPSGPNLIAEHDITFDQPDVPFNTSGGSGDIFLGIHRTEGKVAVKRLRCWDEMDSEGEDDAVRRFQREGQTWCRLKSPYLQPFIGVYYLRQSICLVSPFAENGSLPGHLKRNPGANRRLLLYQTASGIAYLHRCGIIHGDIKGENILVSEEHTAMLSDFGISRPLEVQTSVTLKGAGTTPWQSPEILYGESKSFQSDIYALGMTICEVLKGERPFAEYDVQALVITAIIVQHERPAKTPLRSSSGEPYGWLWVVAERCWDADAGQRPAAQDVVDLLHPDHRENSIGGHLQSIWIWILDWMLLT